MKRIRNKAKLKLNVKKVVYTKQKKKNKLSFIYLQGEG